MDRSIQYSNFDSAYNTAPNFIHRPTVYVPVSSSSSFSSHEHRSISPSLRSSNLKFNLDLYQPNEYHSESIDYPSPSSSVIIHHHPPPVYSPPPSQAISKLRQINDELCHTLARCELPNQSQSSPVPSHHHIHHYPIPHKTYRSRSRSPSEQDSSSSSSATESEPIPKRHNARITHKAHIPRRQNSLSKLDQLLISTSDAYSNDDPMTVDVYPTRDQGFVKKIRNRPDNQSPWLANTSPIRRNSFSESSTYRTPRTPRAPYYDDKLLQPKSRLATGKERPRSWSVKSRIRPDSAPNPLRQSAVFFSTTTPTWRPSGLFKRPKFIGSNAPPSKPKPLPHEPRWNPAGTKAKAKEFRAFDPVSKIAPPKIPEPVWSPPSKSHPKKIPKYFEPTLKPELIVPIQTQTQPLLKRTGIKKQPKISSANPQLKTRIVNAESKVKSAWEPTATTTTAATVKESKPPIPRPVKKQTTIPPKTKAQSIPSKTIVPSVKKAIPAPSARTDTGRSSLNDVPTKPMFQSTPMNQSVVDENENSVNNLFGNDSEVEHPKKQEIPHPPPRVEKTPPKLPSKSVPEPDKGTKSTIKDGVLIHGDDHTPEPLSETIHNDEEDHRLKPSPIPPERKVPTPKPNNRDDVSIVDNEEHSEHIQAAKDDTDGDAERSFEMDGSLDEAPKPTTNASKKDNAVPPRREEPSPPLESPDQNLHKPPVIPKKNDQQKPTTPPPPATTHEADDFFDQN